MERPLQPVAVVERPLQPVVELLVVAAHRALCKLHILLHLTTTTTTRLLTTRPRTAGITHKSPQRMRTSYASLAYVR